MKAMILSEYGPPEVLRLAELQEPRPKADEIAVRIRATPVNFGDLMARNYKAITPSQFTMPFPFWILTRLFFGVNRPRIRVLGNEFAGDVAAVGRNVRRFKEGDAVFGYRGMKFGAYAERLCMPEKGTVALKPENMSYERAAAVPYGAIVALSLLENAGIQPGHKVLVNGASGSIGSFALQLAKYYGAEVTGVCGTLRIAMVKSLGADKTIDYGAQDFTATGETYDVIVDVLGKQPFGRCRNSLKRNGLYLPVSFKTPEILHMLLTGLRRGKRVVCALARERTEDLEFIRELVEAGDLASIVDKRFPLEQAAEAHRYAESGKRTGSVVITV